MRHRFLSSKAVASLSSPAAGCPPASTGTENVHFSVLFISLCYSKDPFSAGVAEVLHFPLKMPVIKKYGFKKPHLNAKIRRLCPFQFREIWFLRSMFVKKGDA